MERLNDDYECPDPIRSYKAKLRIIDDQERSNEHLAPSTRTNERLQSEVPSFTRTLGARTVEFAYRPENIDTDAITCTVKRVTEGLGCGEFTT